MSSDFGSWPPGYGFSSGNGEEPPDIYTLVMQAANGQRELSEDELNLVADHVVGVGFDPDQQIPATRTEGLTWKGNRIYADTLLSSADFHYLYHVRRSREWPEETTQEHYEESIRTIINDLEYNLDYDRWTTAFQPLLTYLEEPDREDAKWLRRPK